MRGDWNAISFAMIRFWNAYDNVFATRVLTMNLYWSLFHWCFNVFGWDLGNIEFSEVQRNAAQLSADRMVQICYNCWHAVSNSHTETQTFDTHETEIIMLVNAKRMGLGQDHIFMYQIWTPVIISLHPELSEKGKEKMQLVMPIWYISLAQWEQLAANVRREARMVVEIWVSFFARPAYKNDRCISKKSLSYLL